MTGAREPSASHPEMLRVRQARAADVPTLVELMREFYGEAGFPLPSAPAAHAFAALLGDPRLGGVWIAEDGSEIVGHAVLALCFSMEYGGIRGVVDDLYVRPAARGRGAGAALLATLRSAAATLGLRALHVEVGPENEIARRLYARAGYVDGGHLTLALPLAAPVHESEERAP